MNQSPVPFARRSLKRVDEAGPGEHEFTVVTYNILADHWIRVNATKKDGEVYTYCPNDFKLRTQGRNSQRHILFMEEVGKNSLVNIFCIIYIIEGMIEGEKRKRAALKSHRVGSLVLIPFSRPTPFVSSIFTGPR